MYNQWGGSFEIKSADDPAAYPDEGGDDRNRDLDRGALVRRQMDETQMSWLLGKEDPNNKKKKNKEDYIDFGCIICKRKLVKVLALCFFLAFVVIGIPIIVVKTRPKHNHPPPPPDNYSDAIRKALMFFNAQKSGWLPKDNGVPWRGNSGINDGSTLSDVKGGLVGGYYDAGDNIKFHFPMAFSMTLLSWSVIEYSHKYKELGEYDHVRDIIKWGTDYLLLTFNSSASKIDHIYSQVGTARNVSTQPDDHYCWMRPENMDYIRPVNKVASGPDLAGEMAAAFAAASIVFRDDAPYSKKLVNKSITVFNFARDGGRRVRYMKNEPTTEPFYNSTDYYDEYIWSSTWIFYATGNKTFLSLATHPKFSQHARAFYGTLGRKVFSWDNKLPAAELLLTRLRVFLNPGFPYEDLLMAYHNTTGLNLCSYFKDFNVFNYTKGGLILLNQKKSKPLQYAANAAFLASLYADYILATDVPGFYCGSNFFPVDALRQFARSQVDYILGANPRQMSYLVGFGSNYPTHIHHRGASIPNDGKKYSCKGGWKWRDIQVPNPNNITGAMVGGPDQFDGFQDVRTNQNYTEPTLAGNAGLVVALISLTTSGGGGTIDRNTMFVDVPSFVPPPPPPPMPWKP